MTPAGYEITAKMGSFMTVRTTSWRINKEIPVTLLLAILFQSGSLIWFASAINVRVANLEEKAGIAMMTAHEVSDLRVQVAQMQARRKP